MGGGGGGGSSVSLGSRLFPLAYCPLLTFPWVLSVAVVSFPLTPAYYLLRSVPGPLLLTSLAEAFYLLYVPRCLFAC